ncbi:chemotaxis protein CheR [Corallococcus exiguus]|uniref:CheR family methyltransferase n=1 Tax=Corallococcus TaxID=83461 RepID=UPI000EA2C0A4|nr:MULTISPECIES: CheR family methyltransferase [unclassified Corallococcus]NRD55662.1 chemotaxis protein CheR [Corallococcus exiguus]NRD63854.1 chemotaxis protein CheR [Corallococcus exiguus]RKH30070.1 chemotaxis protein CheR [Corallococcus sp. CA041A]RKI19334.1 chemotaxis protein CheR [Corallococcus sp. AB030]RUO94751.1 chemotaxis protein CheR [Corallococcus sp. AB018]
MSDGLLDDATLAKVEEVLQGACGLTLASSLRRSLEPALSRAALSRNLSETAFLRQLLIREPTAVEAFIEHAVIGETYFFRHPEHLRALASRARLHQGGPFNVWSAGCASGEEPYSIAMALMDAGLGNGGRFRVLATDVSGRALQRAKAGVYSPWSLRRIEPDLEKRFLVPHPGSSGNDTQHSVTPEVVRTVDFRRHNLATDAVPSLGFHAIFCRNVLIYFTPELVRAVLSRLVSALAPGGLLFVSPAEVPLTNGMGLETLDVDGTPVLRMPLEQLWTAGESATVSPPRRDAPSAFTAASLRRETPVPGSLRISSRRPTPSAPMAVYSARPSSPAPVADAPRAQASTPAARAAQDAGLLTRALEAAHAGHFEEAEALAREAARALSPEAYLLLAMVAESRNDLDAAVEAVRKALYLEPQLALGHATLVALYSRLDRREDAERARQNALRALDGLDDEHPLRGVETTMTAGGLRQALAPRPSQMGWQGAR